jgi:hypothetical protein
VQTCTTAAAATPQLNEAAAELAHNARCTAAMLQAAAVLDTEQHV